MKCEYAHFVDGTVQLTAVFESRADMAKFKEVYDKFMELLPDVAPPAVTPSSAGADKNA